MTLSLGLRVFANETKEQRFRIDSCQTATYPQLENETAEREEGKSYEGEVEVNHTESHICVQNYKRM